MGRYGRLVIEDRPGGGGLVLRAATVDDLPVLTEVRRHRHVAPLLGATVSDIGVAVDGAERGRLKQALLRAGWPAVDDASYVTGDPFPLELDFTGDGSPWRLRDYQVHAVEGFAAGGSGVVVLPCGSGKTIVGAAAMSRLSTNTLILATSTVSARQWRRELLARTTLTDDDIGEYSGDRKEIRPVTVATYQVLVTRRGGRYTHLDLFSARDWGLVIYDEVHLLRPGLPHDDERDPESRRRLGLTATLVREDGREGDVFSLIGPKRFDTPWRDLESRAGSPPPTAARSTYALTAEERMAYATADADVRYRVGATAASKIPVVEAIVARHQDEPTLVIGAYLDQLDQIASRLGAPTVTGDTPVVERERLYDAFRMGTERLLVVSKVANFCIDLPRRCRGHPGVGNLRQPPRGSPTPRANPPPQSRQRTSPLLHRRLTRHQRRRLRRPPPTLPGRTGLRLHHRRLRRPARRGGPRPRPGAESARSPLLSTGVVYEGPCPDAVTA